MRSPELSGLARPQESCAALQDMVENNTASVFICTVSLLAGERRL